MELSKIFKDLLNENLNNKTNRGYIIDKGDKIIKLTNDIVEFENAVRLINKPDKNFIKYYDAKPFKKINNKIHYELIMDKIKPLPNNTWDAVDLIQMTLGKQDYMLNDNKRYSFLMELKRNPEWYVEYGDFNKMMSLVNNLHQMYKYANNNGFELFDLRAQNLGINQNGKMVHFDLGSG